MLGKYKRKKDSQEDRSARRYDSAREGLSKGRNAHTFLWWYCPVHYHTYSVDHRELVSNWGRRGMRERFFIIPWGHHDTRPRKRRRNEANNSSRSGKQLRRFSEWNVYNSDSYDLCRFSCHHFTFNEVCPPSRHNVHSNSQQARWVHRPPRWVFWISSQAAAAGNQAVVDPWEAINTDWHQW